MIGSKKHLIWHIAFMCETTIKMNKLIFGVCVCVCVHYEWYFVCLININRIIDPNVEHLNSKKNPSTIISRSCLWLLWINYLWWKYYQVFWSFSRSLHSIAEPESKLNALHTSTLLDLINTIECFDSEISNDGQWKQQLNI